MTVLGIICDARIKPGSAAGMTSALASVVLSSSLKNSVLNI